ncbi:MAG TPA: prepilin-type N-terminal cleavage/methylation domain-containing protein [Longimicrobiales bacterium]|nr:prepilin-type N-terminal cleavage/methylation domain-containing protein [Longimicrobiales bacterium]
MNRRGYTLIEVLLVLMLSTLLLAITVAPVRHARSVLAVRAARSDIAALVAMTRSTAIMTGGATLVVDVGAGTAWIEHGSGVRVGDVQHITARHRVALTASRPLLNLRYDALGIGRMTSAVVHVTSGSVTGTVTISAYGRARVS